LVMYVMSVQEVVFFVVDLFETEGRGEFKCPRCGVEISPNDTTENVYKILDVAMKEDRLDKVILECNKCGSRIHLTGFNLLTK